MTMQEYERPYSDDFDEERKFNSCSILENSDHAKSNKIRPNDNHHNNQMVEFNSPFNIALIPLAASFEAIKPQLG